MIGLRKAFAVFVALYTAAVLVVLLLNIAEVGATTNDLYFVPAIAGTAVGVYLTLKLPENRIGVLMAVMATALVTLGITNLAIPWALESGNAALTVAAVQLSDMAWTAQFVTALVLLPLWFPTGRPLNRRWAWVGRVAILSAAIAQLSFVVSESVCAYESPLSEVCVNVANPWGIDGFAGLEMLLLISMPLAIPAVVSAFVRWRRSDDVERHQIKWFFVAAVGLLAALVVAFLEFNLVLGEIVFAMGLTGVWVAVAVAVLRYRLYEIDRIVSRTISYTVVVGLLVGAVAALAALIGAQFQEPLVVAATTLGVAAVFNPLRKRVQVWVDRRFNRTRYNTERVMGQFALSLRRQVDSDDVVHGWLGVVSSTMQPSSVGIWVRD